MMVSFKICYFNREAVSPGCSAIPYIHMHIAIYNNCIIYKIN